MNRFYNSIKALVVLAAVGSLTLAGCDFTEGNDRDPNAATDAPAGLILTGAEIAQILIQEGDFARVSNIFSAQMTGSDRQYARINNGNIVTDDFSNTWNAAYEDLLGELQLARAGFAAASDRGGVGLTQLHTAMGYGTMTALFGDIPFSEALQPFQFENPAFDPQAQIYAAIIDTLDAAIANLAAGGNGPSIFTGNQLETAYTLKARYCLHIADYTCARNAAQNGISSNANNFVAPHGSSVDNDTNLYWYFLNERSGYLTAASSQSALYLDPASAEYRGNAKTDETARYNWYFTASAGSAELSETGAFAIDEDFTVVSYQENQLILAEAILLSGGSEQDALDALNAARDAADDLVGSGTDEYQDYDLNDFATGGIANNGTDNQRTALLREILEEKYVALIGQIEGYNDVRRTDNFLDVPEKLNGNQVPQRFLYARSELNANSSAPNPVPPVGDETAVNASINYPMSL